MTYCHTCKTGVGAEEERDDEGNLVYTTEPLPEPEVRATPVTLEDPRVSQGVRNVAKPGLKAGWTITGLSYSRGPRVGAKGEALSISDCISLVMRSADSKHRIWAVWIDGKSAFAYVQEAKKSMVKAGSKAAIAYMKEHTTDGD